MTEPAQPTSPTPAAPAPPAAVPARRRGCGCLALFGAVAFAALGAAAYFLTQPTFVFSNELVGRVRLVINNAARVVPPGESTRVRIGRKLLIAEWELERPLSADRQLMGESVRGSWVVPTPRGTVSRAAAARLDTGDYFAPLITNDTDRLLRIMVNAGLDGARDCGCAVRPGARRVFIGYYRLYRNSTVQATDPDGRRATFRDLGPEAQARNWVVGLRFSNGDFR